MSASLPVRSGRPTPGRRGARVALALCAAVSLSVAARSHPPIAQAPTEARNLRYAPAATPDDPAHTLDLSVIDRSPRTLVVFVHGGGWRHGDKASARRIAGTFLAQGFDFAAINYSLSPQTHVAEAAGDVAAAIAFLTTNAGHLGMSVDRVALVGFSAGGHLVALVATDSSYLEGAGVAPTLVKSVVLLDAVALGEGWLRRFGPARERLAELFGPDEARWPALIPSHDVAAAKTLPDFCIFFDDSRPWSIDGAKAFAAALEKRHAPFSTKQSDGRPHMSFVQDLTDAGSALAKDVVSCLRSPG